MVPDRSQYRIEDLLSRLIMVAKQHSFQPILAKFLFDFVDGVDDTIGRKNKPEFLVSIFSKNI